MSEPIPTKFENDASPELRDMSAANLYCYLVSCDNADIADGVAMLTRKLLKRDRGEIWIPIHVERGKTYKPIPRDVAGERLGVESDDDSPSDTPISMSIGMGDISKACANVKHAFELLHKAGYGFPYDCYNLEMGETQPSVLTLKVCV